MPKKIILGSDHAGFELKEHLKKYLLKKKKSMEDVGTHSSDSVDYPYFAKKVAQEVVKKKTVGILMCGSGVGVSIAANRVKGARAALCTSPHLAELARMHNHANILCLGGRETSPQEAEKIVDMFLKTPYSKESRHARRVQQLG